MKRRQKPRLTFCEAALAIAMQSLRTARVWRVRFPDGTEHLRRYQTAVPMLRVLADHRAAVGAEPVQDDGDVCGSSRSRREAGMAQTRVSTVFRPPRGVGSME